MIVMYCPCGVKVEGADDEQLFVVLRDHTAAAHADMNLPEARLRGLVDARSRMNAWDGTTTTLAAPPEVRELAPERTQDFLDYFDRDAFMDNPFWGGCYCLFYQFGGAQEAWEARTPAQNRADKATSIERGEAHGLLAYVDGKPAAWCHAAPRTTLPGLARTDDFRIDDDPSHVGSIVCFNVAAPYRKQGIAAQLLDAACDALRDKGMKIAEAYPPLKPRSDAGAYHGTLGMYEAAGFEQHREGKQYVIVRKAL